MDLSIENEIKKNQFYLIHPKAMASEYLGMKYQLIRMEYNSDYEDNYLKVSFAFDGKSVNLFRYNIMAVASNEDVERWKNKYGEINSRDYLHDYGHSDFCERLR